MSDLNWRDAIIQVLKGSREVMHYTEIAEAIAKQELRREFGIVGDINGILPIGSTPKHTTGRRPGVRAAPPSPPMGSFGVNPTGTNGISDTGSLKRLLVN